MAIAQTDKDSIVYINVEVGTDSYKDRPLKYVNPNLSDEIVYNVAQQFAGLQAHTVNKIKRRQTYTLVEE